jgi:hypothetical protein
LTRLMEHATGPDRVMTSISYENLNALLGGGG